MHDRLGMSPRMLRMIARGLPDEALQRHLANDELSPLGLRVLEAEAHTRGLVHEACQVQRNRERGA